MSSNSLDMNLLIKLHTLPEIQALQEGDSVHDQRLAAQLPAAYILQVVTILNMLEVIDEKLSTENAYKKAVHDFGVGGQNSKGREVYSSIVIRLWIIINKLLDPYYEFPLKFVDPIVTKTIRMIEMKDYNYFIEPLYFSIPMMRYIIQYHKGIINSDKLLNYLISYFKDNLIYFLNLSSEWLGSSNYPKTFNQLYVIGSYEEMLKEDPNILKLSLLIDKDILKALDRKLLQNKLILKQSENIIEQNSITKKSPKSSSTLLSLAIDYIKGFNNTNDKISDLTKNMSKVLLKYFEASQLGGEYKTKKYKTKKYKTKKYKTKKYKTKKYKIKKYKTKKLKY